MTQRDRRACRRDFIARGRLLARSQPAQTGGPAPEFVADSPLRVSDRLKDSPIDLTARESPGRSVSCNGGASRWCPPWIGQVSIIHSDVLSFCRQALGTNVTTGGAPVWCNSSTWVQSAPTCRTQTAVVAFRDFLTRPGPMRIRLHGSPYTGRPGRASGRGQRHQRHRGRVEPERVFVTAKWIVRSSMEGRTTTHRASNLCRLSPSNNAE